MSIFIAVPACKKVEKSVRHEQKEQSLLKKRLWFPHLLRDINTHCKKIKYSRDGIFPTRWGEANIDSIKAKCFCDTSVRRVKITPCAVFCWNDD